MMISDLLIFWLAIVKAVFIGGTSFSVVLNSFRYSHEIRFPDSHGCFNLHLVKNGNEGPGMSLIPTFTFPGIAAVVSFFLCSCTVGPNYVKPQTEVPPSYKEVDGWKMAQPRDDVVRERWWEMFNDPFLNKLEEQVDISNQNIAQAEAQYRQARALVQAARAAYFPTLTAGASYIRAGRGASTGGNVVSQSSGSGASYALTGDASWEPDLWGKVRRNVESARASAQAGAADLEAAKLSARAELAQDYFQLRSLDSVKQLLDATVASLEKNLKLTQNRYRSGIVSRLDVLQADTQLKTTQAQAIDTELQRAQFEHAIAVLIGKPASLFSIAASKDFAMLPPPVPVGLPSELLERRPDIASAERNAAAANARIGIAEAAYYPNITLNASGGFQTSNFAKWLTWPSRFWSVGASVLETVFEGGLRKAQTAQARAAFEASIASYRQTVLTGFQEVEDNIAALRILEDEAVKQDEAVKASRETLQVTLNQYKAGTLSYLNVITAQTTELANERTAVELLGRRMVSSAQLIKALGGGWNASALKE